MQQVLRAQNNLRKFLALTPEQAAEDPDWVDKEMMYRGQTKMRDVAEIAAQLPEPLVRRVASGEIVDLPIGSLPHEIQERMIRATKGSGETTTDANGNTQTTFTGADVPDRGTLRVLPWAAMDGSQRQSFFWESIQTTPLRCTGAKHCTIHTLRN
ncbi:MAG: hypothetical protein OHK0029_43290 [Armatimonadaceae bacterium]